MLATTAIPILEHFDKTHSMLGINYLSSMDAFHQAPFWLGVASYEAIRMGRGWVNPFTTNTTYMLTGSVCVRSLCSLCHWRMKFTIIMHKLSPF